MLNRLTTIFPIFMLVLGLGFASSVFAAAFSTSSASSSSGGVTVEATYSTPQPNNELRFEVIVDSQKVPLSRYQLKNIALLRDASGKTHQPVTIVANGSEHHRSAEIYFSRPAGGAQEVELVIKDLAGVKERVLRFWMS